MTSGYQRVTPLIANLMWNACDGVNLPVLSELRARHMTRST